MAVILGRGEKRATLGLLVRISQFQAHDLANFATIWVLGALIRKIVRPVAGVLGSLTSRGDRDTLWR